MIKNLVFEGGGVLGAAYGGSLQELESRKILSQIDRVAGTSAGAITATLVALKYTAQEITDIINNANFNSFVHDSIFTEMAFPFDGGLHTGNNLRIWIEGLIAKKTCSAKSTFKQLHDLGFLDLKIVGANLTLEREEIFSYDTTPDMIVSDAVRISMSIPFYFDYVKKNCSSCSDKAKLNCKSKDTCILVDGGLFWNYPVGIFDSGDILNPETLGFRLGKSDQELYLDDPNYQRNSIDNFKDYLCSVIKALIENQGRLHLQEDDWNRTVFIDTANIGALDFNISIENKQLLIENGKKGVQDFLNRPIQS